MHVCVHARVCVCVMQVQLVFICSNFIVYISQYSSVPFKEKILQYVKRLFLQGFL